MKLADQLYEAAFVPDRWESALGAVCAASQSAQAAMIFFDRDATPVSIGYNLPFRRVEEFQAVWRDSPAVRLGA